MRRVNFLFLVILGLFFTACGSSDDTWGDWGKSTEFGGIPRVGAVSFTINNVAYVGLGYNAEMTTIKVKELKDFWKFENGSWVQIADFPGDPRYNAVAFVVGNKAYVGTGYKATRQDQTEEYFKDFYVFDATTGTWDPTPITTFPGVPRRDAIAFSIGNKGYVGTGGTDANITVSDIYSYDPSTGVWANTNFSGDARRGAVSFVIGNEAIVCLGGTTMSGGSFKVDVLKYNPTSGWSHCAPLADRDGQGWDNDYGKIPRSYAVAFVSDLDSPGEPKGYIATGTGSSPRTCWEYNIKTDRWIEVTSLPAMMASRVNAVGFSLGNYGYVSLGGTAVETAAYRDTWKFIPGVDEDDNNDF